MRPLIPFFALSLLAAPAFASPAAYNLAALPEGQTMLNVSANEWVEVEQDEIMADLRIELEGDDPAALQDKVNTMMSAALTKAKAVAGVEITTGQYYVHEDYREPPRPVDDGPRLQPQGKSWRGTQTLTLTGQKADDILNLVGTLQADGLLMNGLSYALSAEKAEETRDGLLEAAIEKLRARASRVAKALGKSDVDLVELNVDSNGFATPPVPVMRAMAMDSMESSMKAPSAEPGKTRVEMTVSARALLKP